MPNSKNSSSTIDTSSNASSENRDSSCSSFNDNSHSLSDSSLLPLGEGKTLSTNESSEGILSYFDPASKKVVYYYDPGSTSEEHEYTSTDESEIDESSANDLHSTGTHGHFQFSLKKTQPEGNGLKLPQQEKRDSQLNYSSLQSQSIFNKSLSSYPSSDLDDARKNRGAKRWVPYNKQ